MELNKKIFSELISLVDSAKKNKEYELEARIRNNNIMLIDEESYKRVFNKLTFSKENNGFGYKYEMKNILDVILDKSAVEKDIETIRMSINGEDNIKKYWLTSSLDNLEPIFIEKEKIDKIDDNNYNIRFSLNNELSQNNLLTKNKELLSSNNSQTKVYRLKNRYSIKTDDRLFLIEMSQVKMGVGNTFKVSNTLKNKPTFEIEIEFIGKDLDFTNEEISKKLVTNCYNILKILQNSNIIISNSLINSLKQSYKKLINNNNDDFIAASPVTIHRENLFRSDIIKNIYNKYAVTLKADGERNFLFVYQSDDELTNGKIFIFNNNFKFIDTGYVDTNWVNTLIEGEFITENNEIYMYDILFSKGEDIRKRYLVDVGNTKYSTRLETLNEFIKSNSRKPCKEYKEENCMKLKNKKYLQSIRNDGTDIFDKIKEIWDTRKFNSFNVDGIILTPKYEPYKYGGGSWYSLFKWKPPQLNTIDFLIKIIKDDNNKEIKYPYIQEINRIDGKQETILKQYKTIQLYVTGSKSIYINQKQIRTRIPVLFNPYGLDDKNSEKFNIAKIFLEDDEKLYAIDPLTNEKVEIYDDIIVEFGYDENNEDEFKWIPYRFRKDKTSLYKNGKEMFGNGEKTANDVFRAIKLPITDEMITTGNIPVIEESGNVVDQNPYYVRENNNESKRERMPYQNFHNHYVKYQLLYFSSPCYINEYKSGYNGKILDLCCGRGVDINKIKRARYSEIVGIDIDYKNIKDAQEFYKSFMPPPKAFYVRGDTRKLIWPIQACGETESEKIYTKKFIPTKYLFDTVSLQFCFHYFFEDEITFRTIIQNMNDNLKIGGFVIGTTFDGERVYNLLNKSDSISGKKFSGEIMWKIEKKYTSKFSFTDKKGNFGKKIDVFVKTIGAVHSEYLVNFNYMKKIMEDYGFSMVFIKPFEELYNELMEGKNLMDLSTKELEKDMEAVKKMSEDEKRFSFLSSAFMFKKERNSSDALMKKLVDLMEKKNKVNNKGVTAFKVDADTEHLIEEYK